MKPFEKILYKKLCCLTGKLLYYDIGSLKAMIVANIGEIDAR